MKSPSHSISFPVSQLAPWLKNDLSAAQQEVIITGFASLRDAQPGDLSFLAQPRYGEQLAATHASAVLVPLDWTEVPDGVVALRVANPSSVFEEIVEKYSAARVPAPPGIHPTAMLEEGVLADHSRVSVGANAVIESGASLGEYAEIGAGCYLGKNVRIGSHTRLSANVTILEGCVLGDNVIIHPGAVIGADGFGYEMVRGRYRKIRQAGIVQIDNDVEIGANTTIDRARIGRTWIGEGTKIDNQVQIGHNVIIGKHCIIVAGVGVAGSAQLGDYVVIAAQAGVAGHITVGSQCTIGARAGVTKDLAPGPATYMGFPASPASEERRRIAANRQVPELLRRVKKLEQEKQG